MRISDLIDNKTITEGRTALDLFVDRYQLIRLFLGYLNDPTPHGKIFYLYGAGGNGKSLLLKYLEANCCKRLDPDNWEYVISRPNDEFERHVVGAEGTQIVPSAKLDFGMIHGDDRPQDAFSGLLKLRRDLAHHVHFPLFDFACVWYLCKKGQYSPERVKELFPTEEFDLIMSVASAISNNAWVNVARAVVSVFDKHLGEHLQLHMKRRKLDGAQLQKILDMDPESELFNALPELFAEDINVAVTSGYPERVVLFFDTHEAFWLDQRDRSDYHSFQLEMWLRRLLSTVDLGFIVPVVAGRERPRWAKANRYRIPEDCIEAHHVDNLPVGEARRYLHRAGIADAALQHSLLNVARVTPYVDEVHPLYLGLCVDVVKMAERKGKALTPDDFTELLNAEGKAQDLIEYLYKYTDGEIKHAVRALSACRAFNWEIYETLGTNTKLRFQATRATFETLTQFSFVWQDDQHGANWYRIHDLLRRLILEQACEESRRTDEVLVDYYEKRFGAGQLTALGEAIYHAGHLDWQDAATTWIKAFAAFRRIGRYDVCRILLGIRDELQIPSPYWRGTMLAREAAYYQDLTQYDAAKQAFDGAIFLYNEALQCTPQDVTILKAKGYILSCLGNLQEELGQGAEAALTYDTAIDCLKTVLRYEPDNVFAHWQQGLILESLGNKQVRSRNYVVGLDCYTHALAAFDAALSLQGVHDYDDPHHNVIMQYNVEYNRALVATKRADVQKRLGRDVEIVANDPPKLTTIEPAFQHRFDDLDSSNARRNAHEGEVLKYAGDMQKLSGRNAEACESYQAAITAYDAAIRATRDDPARGLIETVSYLQDKAFALEHLGRLQGDMGQDAAACQSFTAAAEALTEATRLAPDHISSHRVKGLVLEHLGDVQRRLGQDAAACQSFTAASEAFTEALRCAPNDGRSCWYKGMSLVSLGRLQANMGENAAACQNFTAASEAFAEATRLAPDNVSAYKGYDEKGRALGACGSAQTRLGQDAAACQSFTAASEAFAEATRLAPDNASAYEGVGHVFKNLGHMQERLGQDAAACQSFTVASEAFAEALRRKPADIWFRKLHAQTFRDLGDVQIKLQQETAAAQSYQVALASCNAVLQHDPSDAIAARIRDVVHSKLHLDGEP